MNVVWQSYNSPTCYKTQWDMTLLEESLDKAGAKHFNSFDELRQSNSGNGQVFTVVAGQHQLNFINNLNEDLSRFEKAVLCVVGDEENLFPVEQIHHSNITFIIQSPKPGRHDKYPDRILFGYPPDLKQFSLNTAVKNLDWFFAGQVNHKRREDCCNNLRTLSNGVLLETSGFLQGFSRWEYLAYMGSAKIIPCPSGIASPDSFRVCEALECGCVPIVDGLSPRPGYEGFWEYVLGEKPPFPVVYDWNDFPEILEQQLALWPKNQLICAQWWANYKNQLSDHLKNL